MKVWLGIYEHKHGEDIGVYATEALAERARADIAAEWWDKEIDTPMPQAEPPNVIADMYFDAMAQRDHGEHFRIEEHEVFGATAHNEKAA